MPSMDRRPPATSPQEAQLLHQGPPGIYQGLPSIDHTWDPQQHIHGYDPALGYGWYPTGAISHSQCMNHAGISEPCDSDHGRRIATPHQGAIPVDYASSHDAAESAQSSYSPTFSAMSVNCSPAVHIPHPAMVGRFSQHFSQPHGQMMYHPNLHHQAVPEGNCHCGFHLGPPAVMPPATQDYAIGHTIHGYGAADSTAYQPLPLWAPAAQGAWHTAPAENEQSLFELGPGQPLVISSPSKRIRRNLRSNMAHGREAGTDSQKIEPKASPASTLRSLSSHAPSAAEENEADADADVEDDAEAEADEAAQLAYDDEEELAIGRECINSRKHPIFERQKEADGMFHCPFEHKGKCGHKPQLLPCDYNKMVEAHIKQYRCLKSSGCEDPMTSAAIRFRHEREQHEKPKHKCLFGECSRATDDGAFPRAYNRNDHMIRAHGWIPDTGPKRKPASNSDRKRKRVTQKTAVQKRMRQSDKKAVKDVAPTTAQRPSHEATTAAADPTTNAPSLANMAIADSSVPSPRSRVANTAIAPAPATNGFTHGATDSTEYNSWAPYANDTVAGANGFHDARTQTSSWDIAPTSTDRDYQAAQTRWHKVLHDVRDLINRVQSVDDVETMEQIAQQGSVLRDMAIDIQVRFNPTLAAPLQPWDDHNAW